jgi:hypothetical protein
MRSLFERLVMFALSAALAGCATMKSRDGRQNRTAVVAGVWEGTSQSTLPDGTGAGAGDTRIERQAWRLDQKGDTVTGF